MAVFPRDADTTHPADFALVRDGGLALLRHETALTELERNLLNIGYTVVHLDAGDWDNQLTLHQDIASGLRFPSYYGRNLDALDDCLYDVAHGDYGWNPDAEGLCISLRNFAGFASRSPQAAAALAASFADASRLSSLRQPRPLATARRRPGRDNRTGRLLDHPLARPPHLMTCRRP